MREVQFREAVCEAMSEEMRRDSSVFLLGEEVAEYNGAYKASKGMLDEFGPERVIDTPIAELGFAGIAVGAAMNGLRPIVEFMTWNFAILAADQLEKEGIEVEIIDLVTIRPLDLDTIIESIKKTNRLVIVEESFPVASISSEVAYRVQRNAFDYLDAPIVRLCQTDTPFAFSPPLIEEALPQVKDIMEAVKSVAYVA